MRKDWCDILHCVDGWLEIPEGETLISLAKGKDCLEIGSYKGRSTVAMASVAKSVFAVDTFKADSTGQTQKKDFVTLSDFQSNIKGYGNISYAVGKSQDILPSLNRQFDLVFIDGLHTYQQVQTDIKVSWNLVKDDGVYVFHDYLMGQVKLAIIDVFDESKIEVVQSLAWANKKDGKIK